MATTLPRRRSARPGWQGECCIPSRPASCTSRYRPGRVPSPAVPFVVRIEYPDGRTAYLGHRVSGTIRTATGLDAAARFRSREGAADAANAQGGAPRFRACRFVVEEGQGGDAAAAGTSPQQ